MGGSDARKSVQRFSVRHRDQMTGVAAMLAPRSAADAASETLAAIATFMRDGSLEATRPNADDVAAMKAAAVSGFASRYAWLEPMKLVC